MHLTVRLPLIFAVSVNGALDKRLCDVFGYFIYLGCSLLLIVFLYHMIGELEDECMRLMVFEASLYVTALICGFSSSRH